MLRCCGGGDEGFTAREVNGEEIGDDKDRAWGERS